MDTNYAIDVPLAKELQAHGGLPVYPNSVEEGGGTIVATFLVAQCTQYWHFLL